MGACRRGGTCFCPSVDVCWSPQAFEASLDMYRRLQDWISLEASSTTMTPLTPCERCSTASPDCVSSKQEAPRIVPDPGLDKGSPSRKRVRAGDTIPSLTQPMPPKGSTQDLGISRALIPLKTALIEALATIKFALKLFGPRRTVVSFNGGKDAVVLVHLYCAVLAALHTEDEEFRKLHCGYIFTGVGGAESTKENCRHNVSLSIRHETTNALYLAPRVIFFHSGDEFPAVEAFVAQTARELELDLRTFEGHYHSNIRRCFQSFGPDSPQAVLLGLRVSDPNSESQQLFEPSSSWLKDVCFLRVHPILHWNYGHVWDFLRRFHLSYCQLYDRGYTSLGPTKTTHPNPYLKVAQQTSSADAPESKANDAPGATSDSVVEYLPAFELADWRFERSGRVDSRRKRRRHPKRKSGTGEPPVAAPSQEGPVIPQDVVAQDSSATVNDAAPPEEDENKF